MDSLKDPSFAAAAVTVVVAFVYAVAARFKRSLETRKPVPGLPMPEPCHWLHGHAMILPAGDFRDAVHRLMVEFADSNRLCAHWLGNMPVLTIANWKDARQILMTEYSRREMGLLDGHLKQMGGRKNFLITNGKEWKKKRDTITHIRRRVYDRVSHSNEGNHPDVG